jgi:hypothetical protein
MLHGSNSESRMSALGQKQTLKSVVLTRGMSALSQLIADDVKQRSKR